MAKYTIEDVEILRQKSGISYEEAVNLLEYHNGSLARALVDLEKNGRLKTGSTSNAAHKGWKGAFDFLFHLRMKVTKDETIVINLSALFLLFVLLTAPHICIVGLLIALVLGYRIRIERNCKDFASDHFDDIVKNAKNNVQQAVSGMAKQFTQSADQTSQPTASAPRTEAAPSGTRPVNVQFPNEASIHVHDDGDGYHEADIR